MGAKDSKLSCILQEEALRRVSEAELKRLKDAFKRVSTLNGFMTENVFIREVLWDGVPTNIAQLLFKAFGGTSKGLSFKELLAGLVVLTKGSQEERIKLIFGMFADDTFSYIQKDDMDRKVVSMEDHVPHALSNLFAECDQVTYDQFHEWVCHHPEATVVTKWLLTETVAFSLSSDTETPTFYQTLAGVTHLEETDISELEKKYWTLKAQSKTGRFDEETFKSFVLPTIPETICTALFTTFDENRDNHIDFKEIACGISACCRGPTMERQKFCFKIFDTNHDGKLSKKELENMVDALVAIRIETRHDEELETDAFLKLDPATVAMEILASHDSDQDGCITLEEYLVWTVGNVLAEDFLNLLSQICHVVLGLKPQTREEEGRIIQSWIHREERKKKKVAQVWYLISMQWWNVWHNYVSFKISEENGYVPQATSSRSSSNDSRHRFLTQIKNPTGCLPWDDDSVVMVNGQNGHNGQNTPSVYEGSDSKMTSTQYASYTFPRASSSAHSSPRKNHLSPETEHKTRSPSASPKLRKKIVTPQKPGQIDNTGLVVPNPHKVMTLTNEGGRLKRDVMMVDGKDFKLVPEPVWKALSTWYGGSPALPRTVVPARPGDLNPELELYPTMCRLLRHQTQMQRPPQATSFSSVVTGISGMALSTMASFTNTQQSKRYLAYIACFSRCHTMQQVYDFLCNKLRFTREDMRLWRISSKDEGNMTLLDDDKLTVEQAGIEDNHQLLIEVRNKDLTWPEEMSQLAKNKTIKKDHVPTEPGTTGLNNLGNTCFMNAAVQCVSNTQPLTRYFTTGLHLYEINRTNPLGMKGHIAQRYGDLVKDMWSGSVKTTAPLKLRWTIGKYAPRFNGFQQHDSQELLSFLLDGLHEDLNRVHDKPYVELKDSDGRPDEVVASEAWENHLLRNQSVIVDLFHGQLKSQVRCKECDHVSVRFDPFNYLSLPLPMESCIHLEIIVMRLDGSVPVKYGLRLNMDEKYRTLKKELSSLTNIPSEQILLVEIMGPVVKTLPQDNQKIRHLVGGSLYAYQLPPADDIVELTVEEEIADKKPSVSLTEIQRGVSAKKLKAENGSVNKLQSSGLELRDGAASNNNTPLHSRNNSVTSLNNSTNSGNGVMNDSMQKSVGDVFNGFVIAVHRKMTLMDLYFLSSQNTRPSLFGTPIILPCDDKSTNQDLYEFIWKQVARMVSPLPPSEAKLSNHAQDCDDSLCYEYPFTLKVVQKDGFTCAWCPWYRFCRGCSVECNSDPFKFNSSFIAIDWEPTALHLRYQTTSERLCEEHGSVAESRRKQTEPIDLDTCLQAFTKEEELGEEELYYCSKCKKHRLASKKLDIWRLPPILIVNLKRFQFLNTRWVKSHKIVNFPLTEFSASAYLVPRKHSICKCGQSCDHIQANCAGDTGQQEGQANTGHESLCNCDKNNPEAVSPSRHKETCDIQKSRTSKTEQNGCHDNPASDHHSNNNATCLHPECSNLSYDLFAMSCHTGILGGGHYVAFAKNPNSHWYCYNDSSCKEVAESQMDTNAAYILFYQRKDINLKSFLPSVEGLSPDTQEIEDEFESEFKRFCVIQ